MKNIISIDVEDWFHILKSHAVPDIKRWYRLESRIEPNLEKLLAIFTDMGVRVTFFWLGWCAKQHTSLLRRCHAAGHEVGCHTYAHRICQTIGPHAFRNEIRDARLMLEDIIGDSVTTFRSPGLATNSCGCSSRCFQVIREAGYTCDSSTWCRKPAGVIQNGQPGVYTIQTAAGPLLEVPVSTVTLAGRAIMPLGGGHLRILPTWAIGQRISQLHREGRPFVIYVHPRDLDPDGPCLSLNWWRRFKFSVNRKTAEHKINWLCRNYTVSTIRDLTIASQEKYIPTHRLQRERKQVAAFQRHENIRETLAPQAIGTHRNKSREVSASVHVSTST